MAANTLNNIRVICKEGCEEAFVAAMEAWINPDGIVDAYWANTRARSYRFVGL